MKILAIVLISFLALTGFAQSGKFTIDQAINQALKNNGTIRSAALEVESQRELKKTGFDLPKTNVSLLYGQYNSYAKNDNNITISQTIPFTALGSQAKLNRSLLFASELKKSANENELTYQVKQAYYNLAFTVSRQSLLLQQDSLFDGFYKAASLRYKSGETNLLEQTTAEAQRNEVKNQLRNNLADITVLQTQLKTLLNSELLPEIAETSLKEIQFNETLDTTLSMNPSINYIRQLIDVANAQKKLEAAKFAPDFQIGAFSQTLIGVTNMENTKIATSTDRFTGFQVGVAIPLWFVSHQGRVKSAEYSRQVAQTNYQYSTIALQGQLQQAVQQYLKNKNSLAYYKTSALPNADFILRQSQIAFRGGDIGYAEYLLGVRNAINIKEGYLQTLSDYNQSIIYIEFLSGHK